MASGYRLTPLQRGFNAWVKLWVRLGLPPKKYHLMSVTGRRTGRTHTIPVSVVIQNGERWLVCPYGEREWVKNVRVAGRVRMSRGTTTLHLTTTEESNPGISGIVLRAYYRGEPITRKFFQAGANSSLEDFAAEADLHPVFRLLGED